jgi:hypothetical protein
VDCAAESNSRGQWPSPTRHPGFSDHIVAGGHAAPRGVEVRSAWLCGKQVVTLYTGRNFAQPTHCGNSRSEKAATKAEHY